MQKGGDIYKNIYKTGFAAYAILFLFALVFYKERTIFVDIAFHLFHILRAGTFAIQGYRYGAVVTQVFPLIAGKLDFDLDTIMKIYSVAFIIYYTICYYLCGSVLKNYRLALILLFTQLLFTTETFYWIQSELQQGLAFMVVFFAWLNKLRPGKLTIPGAVGTLALLLFATFFHPLLALPMMFTFAYFFINKGPEFDRRILVASAVIFLIAYYVKSKIFVATYDNNAMQGVNNFIYMFPHYFGIASNRRFLSHCIDKFYWVPVFSFVIGIFYIAKKKWLLFLLFTSFVTGFLLLVNLSYPHAKEAGFYMENLYMPLGIIIAVPLVYDILPLLRKNSVGLLFALIVCTGLGRIYLKHNTYTNRLNWERKFLKNHIDNKILVSDREVPMDTLQILWGTPYEFWLLSTTEYGKTASIVIDEHIDKLLWYKWENKEFLASFERFEYNRLPPPYFLFRDTVTHYDITSEYRH